MTTLFGHASRWAFAVAATAALVVSAPALYADDAEKEGENTDPEASQKEGESLSPAVAAAQLALQGEARQSPLLLLAAAEIIADSTISERELEEVESEVPEGETEAEIPDLELDALIARARELAQGDEGMEAAVEAMIAQIESDSRGLVYRQGKDLPNEYLYGVQYKVLNYYDVTRLDPGQRYTLTNVIFEGGLPAEVVVVGDGDGDLDLWVYDGNTGGLIGSDTDLTSVCVVSWTTLYEGPFTIVVENVGSVWERFYVLANW